MFLPRRSSQLQLAPMEAALLGSSLPTTDGFSAGISLTHSFSAAFWLSPTSSHMAAHQQRHAQAAAAGRSHMVSSSTLRT